VTDFLNELSLLNGRFIHNFEQPTLFQMFFQSLKDGILVIGVAVLRYGGLGLSTDRNLGLLSLKIQMTSSFCVLIALLNTFRNLIMVMIRDNNKWWKTSLLFTTTTKPNRERGSYLQTFTYIQEKVDEVLS
jgi:hypothetical protein